MVPQFDEDDLENASEVPDTPQKGEEVKIADEPEVHLKSQPSDAPTPDEDAKREGT